MRSPVGSDGAHEVPLNLNLRFRAGIDAQAAGEALGRLERAIRARHADVKRIFIDVEGLAR